MQTWLAERAGRPGDPLFPTRTWRRLSRDAVALRISTRTATAARDCPSLLSRRVHPHVLRHTCAMSPLRAGVDTSVIALCLGRAGIRSTDPYMHADVLMKEKALALTAPRASSPAATANRTRSWRSSRACDYAAIGDSQTPSNATSSRRSSA
ncbi:tyrosine-type recombinase/integrase [Pseudonocardia sp. GCM10023141]|uniref:tyrosine-type recombinase/integrase n=1 Tax=Pseudonocardia sp. GCM10023141 TaxID=3252653 RepID=UPI00361631DB